MEIGRAFVRRTRAHRHHAGSYTPFCLVSLRPTNPILAWSVFGVEWGMVLAGIAFKLRDEYSLLFKLTDALLHDHSAKKELFRRVTLNVLEHNRDDHLKNFGFLMDAEGHCSLSFE